MKQNTKGKKTIPVIAILIPVVLPFVAKKKIQITVACNVHSKPNRIVCGAGHMYIYDSFFFLLFCSPKISNVFRPYAHRTWIFQLHICHPSLRSARNKRAYYYNVYFIPYEHLTDYTFEKQVIYSRRIGFLVFTLCVFIFICVNGMNRTYYIAYINNTYSYIFVIACFIDCLALL